MYFVIGGILDYLADERGENDAWLTEFFKSAGCTMEVVSMLHWHDWGSSLVMMFERKTQQYILFNIGIDTILFSIPA